MLTINTFKNILTKIFIIFIIFFFLIFGSACSKKQTVYQEKSGSESETTLSLETNEEQETESTAETKENETNSEQTEKTARKENSEKEDNASINYENNFILASTEGKQISLSDFAGKIVVLNFWATWCPPCKAEIPDFIEVYADFKDKDVAFLGVSLDDDINALKQFIFDFNITYPVVIDNQIANVAGIWGISAIPTTYFINIDGKILDKWVGQIPKEELKAIISKYLEKNKA